MDIILEFKKLAVALQQDDRLIYLDQARKMNDMDKELQGLIEEFNAVRLELNTEISKQGEDRDNDKIQSLNAKLTDVYKNVMDNDSMTAYNEAKQEADLLSQHINAIIAAAFSGEDPMQAEIPQNCADGCSSCSGCGI